MFPVSRTEYIGSPALTLRLPRCNLIEVNVELLGKLRQHPIALGGGKRYLHLERRHGSGAVAFARPLQIRRQQRACHQAEIPPTALRRFPRRALKYPLLVRSIKDTSNWIILSAYRSFS
jgi:hypothetical protein